MRAQRKNITIHDGKVTEILRGENSTQVELENTFYDRAAKEIKTEPVTLRLDNPAQAEGLAVGTKVAIFRDAAGHTNLVREGQWKSGGECMVAGKKDPSKQYDNGTTVIMGKCTSAGLRTPEGKQPFFALNVVTDDHTQHHISIYNRASYDEDAIEKAQDRFKEFLANEQHEFIPFTGTFVTNNCSREGEHEFKGQTYQDRNYFGLTVLGGYNDYVKAAEKQYASPAQEAPVQEAPSTSQDMNAGLDAGDGFVIPADMDFDEELPFN